MTRDYNGGVLPSRTNLMKQRLLPIGEYVQELSHGSKLTKRICAELYGSHVVPIPVPLKRYESMHQYEKRFCEWLSSTRSVTLEDLRSDPARERNYRMSFARKEGREYEALLEGRPLPAALTARSFTAQPRIKSDCGKKEAGEELSLGIKRAAPVAQAGECDDGPLSKKSCARGNEGMSPLGQEISRGDLSDQVDGVDAGDQVEQTMHQQPAMGNNAVANWALHAWKNDLAALDAFVNTASGVAVAGLKPDLQPLRCRLTELSSKIKSSVRTATVLEEDLTMTAVVRGTNEGDEPAQVANQVAESVRAVKRVIDADKIKRKSLLVSLIAFDPELRARIRELLPTRCEAAEQKERRA